MENVVVIENITNSMDNWERAYAYYNKILQDGFEDDDTILTQVRFKFAHESEETYVLYLTGFIINMAIWKPFVYMRDHINIDMRKWGEEHILNPRNLNKKTMINKIDEIIVKPYRRLIPNRDMNEQAYSVTKCWKDLAEDYGSLLAISINVFDEVRFCEENEEYNDLLHTDIPEDMQAKEIEKFVKQRCNRVIEMIMANPDHCLSPILISGEGIKQKQFKEYSTSVGTKPDGQGGIHPLPVNTSFIRGHKKVSDFFIDGTSGRIAQIIQRRNVSSSGAFARQLGLLAIGVQLHEDSTYDCGTRHRINFEIKSKDHLKGINGMYICYTKYEGEESEHEFMLDLDEDDYSFLIGTTVRLRTAVTCASKKICHKCYGDLAYTNSDINIGLLASTELTEKLTQTMLSAKHLLESDAKEVTMSMIVCEDTKPIFDSYKDVLYFQMDTIRINDEDPDLLANLKLVITSDDLEIEETKSDIREDNDVKIYMNSFKLVDSNGGGYEIQCSEPMYITDELAARINAGIIDELHAEIPMNELYGEDDNVIAYISLENNEISKTFNELKSVIGSEKAVSEYTIDTMYNRLCNVLIDAHYDLMLTHAAVLMRPLVRSAYDPLKMPNWQTTDYRADYKLYGVQKSVMKDPSLVVSMAFERLKSQFTDPVTFDKHQSSIYDVLFTEKSTD